MIYNNSHICIISIDMSRKSVMKLPSIVNDVLSGTVSDDVKNHCRFFHNIGNNRSILQILYENLDFQEPFQFNNKNRVYFVEESLNEISDKNSLFILFELHSFEGSSTKGDKKDADQIVDAINFEYVCLLYHYLKSKNINFFFAISGCIEDNRRFTPISNNDFHRVRSFLFLESIYGINERMRVFIRIRPKDKTEVVDNDEIKLGESSESNKETINVWARFYKEQNVALINDIAQESKDILNKKKFGKILPLIQINPLTYYYLQESAKKPDSYVCTCLVEKRLRELLDYYMARIEVMLSSDIYGFIESTQETDNLFEAIYFASSLYYLKDSLKKRGLTLEETTTFHEKCIDCAQGCFQLFENSYYHVVNEHGWANIALRIRKTNKANAESKNEKKTNSKSKTEKVPYVYEFNNTDLVSSNTSSLGIVRKFIENHPNYKFDKIELGFFFGEDDDSQLANFFSKKTNIANHYGLMILNNVVTSNQGTIRVRSGKEIFSSIKEERKDEFMPWNWGTAYTIDFPIVFKTEEPNYYDSIAFENMVLPNIKPTTISFSPRNNLYKEKYLDYRSKDVAVKKIKDKLDIRILNSKISAPDQTMLVVDCSDVNDNIQYEILAKAFFLVLCDTDSNNQTGINNLAFVNLKSRHHAIRLFRHFALFYNRSGTNKFLNNANIFIVDKDASLPLHFMGSINDIYAEMNYLAIYGGVDSMAIAVLNALWRHFDES